MTKNEVGNLKYIGRGGVEINRNKLVLNNHNSTANLMIRNKKDIYNVEKEGNQELEPLAPRTSMITSKGRYVSEWERKEDRKKKNKVILANNNRSSISGLKLLGN